MPKGIALTEEEQAARRREIFNAAVDSFLKKGFQETTMREIAELAGMGKSTLYDYFKNKDEILTFIFEEGIHDVLKRAEQIAQQDIPVIERIQQIAQMHLEFLVAHKNLFLILTQEIQRLKMQSQQRIQLGRYAYQDLMRSLIEEGIREGVFRPVDALLAARLLVNSMGSVVFTSRPTATPQALLSESLEIFLRGICA